MQIHRLTHLHLTQKEILFCLWNSEYPTSVAYERFTDFDAYLSALCEPRHYLLQSPGGDINGWAFTFLRESEKWFALLLDGRVQGRGYGTRLLNELKTEEPHLCGWVIDHHNGTKQNGEPYRSPLRFYQKNGFILCSAIRLETERLSAVKIMWGAKQADLQAVAPIITP